MFLFQINHYLFKEMTESVNKAWSVPIPNKVHPKKS